MFTIDRQKNLIRVIFAGQVNQREAEEFVSQMTQAAEEIPGGFFVLVDLRRLELFPPESRSALIQVQQICASRGMVRSVVIHNETVTEMQLKLIARDSRILAGERYVNAEDRDDWEEVALAWLFVGVEPEPRDKTRKAANN